jgi:hypothetical protein
MKAWLMILLSSLVLGATFTGASYFVTSQEDVVFDCDPSDIPNDVPNSNVVSYGTYTKTENGFPFAFIHKESAAKPGACQKPKVSAVEGALSPARVDKNGNFIDYSYTDKDNFIKDMVIYSAGFLILGLMLFGTKKKQ